MNERWIFIGTGACTGRVDAEYRCAFWADNPLDPGGFDPQRLTDVDLRRSPAHARSPDDVIVDDFITDGGMTTIGPGFPAGNYFGAAYLEEKYVASLPPNCQPAVPPRGSKACDYEFKTVYYWPGTADPRAGRRYVGTHAEIIGTPASKAPTNVCDVLIWAPGTSATAKPAVRAWIDLDSIDYCDPEAMQGLTRLTPTRGAGALYLAQSFARQSALASPKLPSWKAL